MSKSVTPTLVTIAQRVDSVPWFSVAIFAAAAVIFLAASALMLARGYLMTDPFRLAIGVTALGFAIAMGFEAKAIITGTDTISRVTELAFIAMPIVWVAVLAGIQLLDGALIIHFTRVEHKIAWWPAAIGLAAWLIGVASSAVSTWEP